MRQVSASYSPSLPRHVLACCPLPCHRLHFHIRSSCASHLHTCSSHASEHLPCCPFCIPALRSPPASPFTFSSCAGIKLSRNGPRLDMWPWFTTGRPPVKFRIIWTLFDTPTVNRVAVKASLSLCSPTPLHFGPKPT